MSRMAELMDVLSHGAEWRTYLAPPRPKAAAPQAPPPQVVRKHPDYDRMVVSNRRHADGHLSPTAEKALLYVAQRGRVTTKQASVELDMPRSTLTHTQNQMVDGGYVEYQRGAACHPGMWTVTRKGLERAGMDPDSPPQSDVQLRIMKEPVPDSAIVKCKGCAKDKPAADFYRRTNGDLRKDCKKCLNVRRRGTSEQREAGD